MEDRRNRTAVRITFLIFTLIWTGIALYVIPKLYALMIVPDELGYWAHAAYWAGYDWHEATNLFSYYSFGYSIIIYPFFRLISNPVILYRMLVGVNFLLMWMAIYLLYLLMRELFPQIERKRIALISGSALLYVAYVTYVQITLTEIVLLFLYVLLAYRMMVWCRRPGLWNAAVAFCIAGYMYIVHMRTIGILLVTAACLLLFSLRGQDKKKKWFAVGLVIVGFLIVILGVALIKEGWILAGNSESYREFAKINGYSSAWNKLRALLTWSGIGHLLGSIGGKVFYLGCASFGVYFWGIGRIVKQLHRGLKEFREKQTVSAAVILYLWFFLSHIAALMITAIANNSMGGRLDSIFYGRYHENTIPVILALGLYELIENSDFGRRMIPYICIQSPIFTAVYYLLIRGGRYTTIVKHSITGIIYAVILGDYYDNHLLILAFAGGILGCLVLCAAGKVVGGRLKWQAVCIAFCVLQLVLAGYATKYAVLVSVFSDRENSKVLQEVAGLTEGQTGIYLATKSDFPIGVAQYTLREPLRVISIEEYRAEDFPADSNFLVLTRKNESKLGNIPEDLYAYRLQTPTYTIYYNLSD